jgi:rubrerythrin
MRGLHSLTILRAVTLEHLEDTFYRQALEKYSESDFSNAGFDSSVRQRIQTVSNDEKTHVSFLSTALQGLNQTPTAACEYAFGYTDVKSFLAVAQVLEGVGYVASFCALSFL